MTAFNDHFSGHASDYAAHRPTYPAALFDWLAEQAPGRGLVWDAGTGNGQAALALAERFDAVVATDASAEQIANAPSHPAVTFRVGAEAGSGLPDGAADLVTVAQAVHWFDRERFWAEARRVLAPGGLCAVWSYSFCRITPEVDAILDHYHAHVIGDHWPPERALVDSGYADMDFPFARVETPALSMSLEWDLNALCDYLATWSGYRRCLQATGLDPLPALRAQLEPVWGSGARAVTWPLPLHAGRR